MAHTIMLKMQSIDRIVRFWWHLVCRCTVIRRGAEFVIKIENGWRAGRPQVVCNVNCHPFTALHVMQKRYC